MGRSAKRKRKGEKREKRRERWKKKSHGEDLLKKRAEMGVIVSKMAVFPKPVVPFALCMVKQAILISLDRRDEETVLFCFSAYVRFFTHGWICRIL